MVKEHTEKPFIKPFWELSTAPHSMRSTMVSVNISVWIPRCLLLLSSFATAFGMLPIPSWMVEPSSTREATKAPIFFCLPRVGHQGLGGDRAVGLHKGIHLGNMYLCITKGARKVGVDLQQNQRTLIDQSRS